MDNVPKHDPAITSSPEAKNEALAQANTLLKVAGLPTYSDLIATIDALTACAA